MMTKYTSNEQYERDKARLINILIGGGVEDFAVNILKQSKWIGADSPIIINNQPVNQHCTLLKDVDTTTVPI